MKKVLLFPGAFNPPHKGHVALVQTAAMGGDFDEVWIMPSGNRDDGKVISINYDHRRNLNDLFVKHLQTVINIPVKFITVELDDIDGAVGTKEYIRRIKATPDTDVIQLIGSDAYRSLLNHKLIIENEYFLVFMRAGDNEQVELNQGDELFDFELPLISSTTVRNMVKGGGNDYKELVTKEIANYIEEEGLYR